MKKLLFLMSFCLLAGGLFSQNLKSPNGNLELTFSVNQQGTPVYSLMYKGKSVVKPSKLGLALMGSETASFGAEIKKEKDPKTSLYDGFSIADVKNSTTDDTWQPVWGEKKNIRNHYNEMAVTLNQKETGR
ncbi:MAG: glycoside hydrolase family 97 N-terminal domain-containing protein, partial [Dysgonamonadaceae bacterium]